MGGLMGEPGELGKMFFFEKKNQDSFGA